MIERLKFEEHNGIVTYDREEFEKMLKEEFEEDKRKLENKKRNFENQQKNFKNKQKSFEDKQKNFENKQRSFEIEQENFIIEKIELAKKLSKLGISIEEIKKVTKLPIEQLSLYI